MKDWLSTMGSLISRLAPSFLAKPVGVSLRPTICLIKAKTTVTRPVRVNQKEANALEIGAQRPGRLFQ